MQASTIQGEKSRTAAIFDTGGLAYEATSTAVGFVGWSAGTFACPVAAAVELEVMALLRGLPPVIEEDCMKGPIGFPLEGDGSSPMEFIPAHDDPKAPLSTSDEDKLGWRGKPSQAEEVSL